MLQTIKSKQGKGLLEKDEVIERWAEYVEGLYKDEDRGEADMDDLVNEVKLYNQEWRSWSRDQGSAKRKDM